MIAKVTLSSPFQITIIVLEGKGSETNLYNLHENLLELLPTLRNQNYMAIDSFPVLHFVQQLDNFHGNSAPGRKAIQKMS
jgi:hypothetical protein